MYETYDTSAAPGPPVAVVATRGGLAPHLAFVDSLNVTFCGLETSGLGRSWFAIMGCKRCAKAASKKGLATITDIDGETCLV